MPSASAVPDPDEPGVIRVTGDLDVATAACISDAVEAVLGPDCPTRVTLDMSEVGFIDSSGLAELVRAEMATSAAGRSLALRSVPPVVLSPLRTTGLDAALIIED